MRAAEGIVIGKRHHYPVRCQAPMKNGGNCNNWTRHYRDGDFYCATHDPENGRAHSIVRSPRYGAEATPIQSIRSA